RIYWQRRSIRPRTGTAQMAGLMASTTTKSGSAPPTGKLSRACGMLLVILVGFVKFSGTEVMMFSSKASRAQYVQMKYRRSMRTRQGWQREKERTCRWQILMLHHRSINKDLL